MKQQQLPKLILYSQRQQNKDQSRPLLAQNSNDFLCESSIAQEQIVMFSETLINSKSKNQNTQSIQFAPKQFDKVENKKINQNSSFLLAESLNNKAKTVTIHQVKAYEQKAKNQHSQFKLSLSREMVAIKSQHLKQQKNLKKSLSSSKLSRQKKSVIESKQLIRKNQEEENIKNEDEKRRWGEFQFINDGQSQGKVLNRIFGSTAKAVPFSLHHINSAINNLQQEEEFQMNNSMRLSECKDRRINNEDNRLRRKSLNKSEQYKLMRKLSQQKYLVDVPLDLNQFQYQLKMQLRLQKNRGLQLYLVAPQTNQQAGSCRSILSTTYQNRYKDIHHFKYQIIHLPNNIIKLTLYLLVCSNDSIDSRGIVDSPSKSSFTGNNTIKESSRHSYSISESRKQWKVWKEIHIPFISSEKQGQDCDDQDPQKKINITITNVNLNCVRVQINNIIDFHLNLHHPKPSPSYYCIRKDCDGVELSKLSIWGSQSIKIDQNFDQGCQSKCQLI